MQAVIYSEPGRLQVSEFAPPEPVRPDDVLVQVAAVGICGSDLRMIDQPGDRLGNIFGHEIAATVCAAHPSTRLHSGEAVVVNPNVWCQSCWFCRSGMPNLCDNLLGIGSRLNGGAAEFCVVPARLLHPLPVGLDIDIAALAEPLSCVLHALRRVGEPLNGSAFILGAGPIGLLALVALRLAGVRPILVLERFTARATVARALGADFVVEHFYEAHKKIAQMTGGRGVEIAVDASGGNLVEAARSARKGGVVVAIGYGDSKQGPSSEAVVARELRILGSFTGAGCLPAAIDMLAASPAEFATLISHRISLAEAPYAIELLRSGQASKILLKP